MRVEFESIRLLISEQYPPLFRYANHYLSLSLSCLRVRIWHSKRVLDICYEIIPPNNPSLGWTRHVRLVMAKKFVVMHSYTLVCYYYYLYYYRWIILIMCMYQWCVIWKESNLPVEFYWQFCAKNQVISQGGTISDDDKESWLMLCPLGNHHFKKSTNELQRMKVKNICYNVAYFLLFFEECLQFTVQFSFCQKF